MARKNSNGRFYAGLALSTSGLVGLGILLFPRRASATVDNLERMPLWPSPRSKPPSPEPGPERPQSPEPVPADPPPDADKPTPPIIWFGGTGDVTAEALGWMLSSENPRASELVWFLQAVTANNVARARRRLGISSIRDLLQSRVVSGKYTRGIGYGRQRDKAKHITRWAATSAALKGAPAPRRITTFVSQLLSGRIDPLQLRGLAGERPPPAELWPHLTSFLQHHNFDAIVAAQTGGPGKTEAEVVTSWGSPNLLAQVDGVRFFGHLKGDSRPEAHRHLDTVAGVEFNT